MKYRIIFIVAVLALLLSSCTLSLASDITPPPNYQSPTPGSTMSPLFPPSAPDLAAGAVIFADKCAPCHGDKGLGDGPMAAQLQKPPAQIGKPEIARAAAPANWFTTVTQGNINSFMPPFSSSLSDQQRWDVVAYALSLGTNTSLEVDRGKTVYEANCVKCHGETGKDVQNSNFTDQSMMAKLTQTDIANFINKGIGKMSGFGGLIPDADIYAAAAYVREYSEVVAEVAAAPSTTPSAQAATPAATPDVNATTSASTPAATLDPNATPGATATAIPQVGTISGKITNGSGGTLPSDLGVVLHIFQHDPATQQFSEVGSKQGTVAADGTYKFDQVTLSTNQAFYVSANYANTNYESDPVFPTAGQSSLNIPLSIYDTSTDTSGLVADQVHILLDYSKADVVQVVEFLIITNPGTKAIVAAQKGGAVVSVVLPTGYSNLQFEQGAIGDRYVKTADGFADTTSVTPGIQKYQLVFAVDLPLPKPGLFGGQKLQFSQPFPVSVKTLSVLVPAGVVVEGSSFTSGGTQDMGNGATYQVYNSAAIAPGKSLNIIASGLPTGSAPITTTPGSNQNIIFGVGAFGVALIITGGWMFWRNRRNAGNAVEDEIDDDDEDNDGASVNELMDAIVALDDQYKAGNIQEAPYKERRAELKAKLKKIL